MKRVPTFMGFTIIWAALVSCQSRPAFWIVPGSTIDNLIFGVSEKMGTDTPIVLEAIYVYRGHRSHSSVSEGPIYQSEILTWAAVINDKELRYPLSRIRYGDTIKGFNIITEAQPLDVNTYYQAHVYFKGRTNKMRSPSVTFWISEQGQVEESLLK